MAPTLSKWAASSLILLASSTLSDASSAPVIFARGTVPGTLPANWAYKGCYTDIVGTRSLAAATYTSGTAMTIEACIAFCQTAGFAYAGTEYSAECYCDSAIRNGATKQADTDCNMNCNGNTAEACGGPNRLTMFVSSAAPVTPVTPVTPGAPVANPGVNGWGLLGCYTDNAAARTLIKGVGVTGGPGAMTVALCVQACAGFKYAGVEYGGECYCDNAFNNGGAPAPDGAAQCNMACNGNKAELCGGPNRLDLYSFGAAAATTSKAPTATTPPAANGWTYMGCYVDSVNARTLKFPVGITGGPAAMTVELCEAACKTAGYPLAGVEYAGECYCDSIFEQGITTTAPDGEAQCNMKCNGNAAENCGGPNRLNIYKYGTGGTTNPTTAAPPVATTTAAGGATGWTAIGCYVDSTQIRTLSVGMAVAGKLTIEACEAACKTAGFVLAGVEYGAECYCDNVFRNGVTTTAPDGNAQCNMACAGNTAEICGGSYRLNVFHYGTGAVATQPVATTPPTTQPTTPVVPPTGWTYRGCYIDNVVGRIMFFPQPDDNALTVEKCIAECAALGYTVAGMQYYYQCFCDNSLRQAATKGAEADCNTPCRGNTAEMCGGPNRDSVYATGALNILPLAGLQQTSGGYTYQGCLITGTNPQPLLTGPSQRPNDNDADSCTGLCYKFGYAFAGMALGQYCYCGTAEDMAAANAQFAPDTDCNTPCPGAPAYYCGANNRVSLYKYTAAANPPFSFATAGGAAAGAYQVVFTLPVTPLIATLGLNNKVNFMEKSGTSPVPGSTGAYELDIKTMTLRTLHLKTDVFCSATLTLPDKVGRQLNIGGWSGDSTYGVRLYWPNGSPGVAGTNDWQENYQELHLAAGRWYPGVCMMANGSILVVGGEQGSNGAPTPSLELLPSGGGTLYMDWLQATDPYNLYPFLVVLPSGNIFVAYYQSARILDEKTFATVRTLPTIPGSIYGDLPTTNLAWIGGRTYPLEGTAVIMPQYPPYTDAITVMLCGGGSPFGGPALDNCASIRPEVVGDNWVVERMPTKRVMSCMVALPDGTYLIMNGALQGTAGFGLAEFPNGQAVLYDPTKPVKQRMTILSSTTIARLYHSEAILLQDGRVLISGSDPEDLTHIQEYRVEIFTPPYLNQGQAAPAYTITNTDWAYNGQYKITITAGAVGKISILGAVSSTHGNSFGQRTFFPTYTCAGGQCTITAPPNSHVCPPGWFQLFVVGTNGAPSSSQWVRVGGDPGNLGAWPAGLADFNVPGSG